MKRVETKARPGRLPHFICLNFRVPQNYGEHDSFPLESNAFTQSESVKHSTHISTIIPIALSLPTARLTQNSSNPQLRPRSLPMQASSVTILLSVSLPFYITFISPYTSSSNHFKLHDPIKIQASFLLCKSHFSKLV